MHKAQNKGFYVSSLKTEKMIISLMLDSSKAKCN